MREEEGDLTLLLARLGASSVTEAEQKIKELKEQEEKAHEKDETIVRLNGTVFCTLSELYGCEWAVYSENDFTSLRRRWEINKIQNEDVLKVYNKTRNAAQNIENRVSSSSTLTTVKNKKPVRLCSHERTHNYAEKAHLCPRTGEKKKVDTWIYAASAVLGMPSDSEEDRRALLKALRGCVAKGQSNVMAFTGLNRSPFNLLSFLLQDIWFDRHPGVVVLPCLDPDQARDWDGEGYSIIILCYDIANVSTADDIAANIALTRTPPEKLYQATSGDISKATSLLRQVVLASAHCLINKEGPGTVAGTVLWKRYKEGLLALQHGAHAIQGNSEAFSGVVVPTMLDVPHGKFVARIDLTEMAPPEPGNNPAYPDPLLLAYKSSVNWTRRFHFQTMAESEPQEEAFDPDILPPRYVFTDQGSKISSDHHGSLQSGSKERD